MYPQTETCPLCGSVIPRTKFVEITRIREQEQKKLADAEAEMRRALEQKFLRDLGAERQAAEKRANEEAQKRVAAIAAERDRGLQKVKQLEDQGAALLKQVQEEGQKRKALEEKYQRDLKAQTEAAARRAAQEAEKRLTVVAAERDRSVQKVKQLEEREAAMRKEATAEAERKAQQELNQQRLILEKAKDQEVLKKEAGFNREREGWQKKLVDLEKKLAQKTANEIGEGAEVDVYEALTKEEAFLDDHITRVGKGQPGADIHHEIMYKGEACGRIVVDSKNRQAWHNSYISKLRQDQTEAGAEQAILATTVFPSGKRELCIESGVIVVNPARVVHIVHLLRNAIIAMHRLGLSAKERGGKMNQLYRLMTSEAYAKRFNEATKLTDDILELDVQEKKAHDNVWKKRGTLATRLNHVLRELDTEISAIVESGVDSEVPAA